MTAPLRSPRTQARVPVLALLLTDRSASSAEPTPPPELKTPLQLMAARRLARW